MDQLGIKSICSDPKYYRPIADTRSMTRGSISQSLKLELSVILAILSFVYNFAIQASDPGSVDKLCDQANSSYKAFQNRALGSSKGEAEVLIGLYSSLLPAGSAKCTPYNIYRARADLFSRLGRHNKETSDRKKITKFPSSNLVDHFMLGNALLDSERYEESVRKYTYVLDRQPNDHNLLSRRSLALYKLGKYELARVDAVNYLSVIPEGSDVRVLLGDIEVGLKNYKKAKKHYMESLRIFINDFRAIGFNPDKYIGSADLARLYVKIALNKQRLNEKNPEKYFKLAVREDQFIYEPYYYYAQFLLNKPHISEQELGLARRLLLRAERYYPANDEVMRKKIGVQKQKFQKINKKY